MRTRIALLSAFFVLSALASAQEPVIHPADGAELNRRHLRFRWEPVAGLVSDYELQIVRDDGSPDPFSSGSFPVVTHVAPAAEPRTTVTSGFEWGVPYAWRARAQTPASLPGWVTLPTRRLRILDLPPNFPPFVHSAPPGAAPVQPGITVMNISRSLLGLYGYAVAADELGEPIWFVQREDALPGDTRQLRDTGRILVLERFFDIQGMNGDGYEIDLDGRVVWHSTWRNGDVHHDVTPMPHGGVLCLTEEFQDAPLMGTVYNWKYDVIREFDRHGREELWSWSAFDWYDRQDYRPQFGPGGDWTHGNACYYDVTDDSIYYSARSISRITKIDHATGVPLWHMGEDMPSGDATFGDNLFSMQHAPEPLPNGNVLIFDNGNLIQPLSAPRQSRAVEIGFDDPASPTTASIVWSFDPVDAMGNPEYSPFVGDADRMPNGNTLMQHGQTGTLLECDPAGQEIWRLQVGNGHPDATMYRADRVDALIVDTPGDTDEDHDLDLRDLLELQVEYVGGNAAIFPGTLSDMDGDGSFGEADVDEFAYWMTGPGRERDVREPNFLEFCFGDGGLEPGCTPCPCGNDVAAGTKSGCANSSGRGARLVASGSTSLTQGGLRLDLEGGVANSFAILVSGNAALPNVPVEVGPCPPGAGLGAAASPALDGLRCVGAGLLRHGTRALNGFGDTAGNPWDPPFGWPGAAMAGEEGFFQAYYRVATFEGCGTGQNTTSAVRVTVVP